MTEPLQRIVPLPEIVRRVNSAPPELQRLSRDVLMDCCLRCQAPNCTPLSGPCVAKHYIAHPYLMRPSYEDETPAQRRRRERRAWHAKQGGTTGASNG